MQLNDNAVVDDKVLRSNERARTINRKRLAYFFRNHSIQVRSVHTHWHSSCTPFRAIHRKYEAVKHVFMHEKKATCNVGTDTVNAVIWGVIYFILEYTAHTYILKCSWNGALMASHPPFCFACTMKRSNWWFWLEFDEKCYLRKIDGCGKTIRSIKIVFFLSFTNKFIDFYQIFHENFYDMKNFQTNYAWASLFFVCEN